MPGNRDASFYTRSGTAGLPQHLQSLSLHAYDASTIPNVYNYSSPSSNSDSSNGGGGGFGSPSPPRFHPAFTNAGRYGPSSPGQETVASATQHHNRRSESVEHDAPLVPQRPALRGYTAPRGPTSGHVTVLPGHEGRVTGGRVERGRHGFDALTSNPYRDATDRYRLSQDQHARELSPILSERSLDSERDRRSPSLGIPSHQSSSSSDDAETPEPPEHGISAARQYYPAYDDNARRVGLERLQSPDPTQLPGHTYYPEAAIVQPEIDRRPPPLAPPSPPPIARSPLFLSSPSSPPAAAEAPPFLLPSPPTPPRQQSDPDSPETHARRIPPQRQLPNIAVQPAGIPDPGPQLREMLGIPSHIPLTLDALPDPLPGDKPRQPYPILVQLAIYGSPRRRLTLGEIYEALEERFEWFRERSQETQWKNSIRHNLSLNKVFRQIAREITEPGKGKYWTVDLSQGMGNKRLRKRNRYKNKKPRGQSGECSPSAEESEAEQSQPEAGPSGRRRSQSRENKPRQEQASASGHIVGQGRVRKRTGGTSSPYPSVSPSPIPQANPPMRLPQIQPTPTEESPFLNDPGLVVNSTRGIREIPQRPAAPEELRGTERPTPVAPHPQRSALRPVRFEQPSVDPTAFGRPSMGILTFDGRKPNRGQISRAEIARRNMERGMEGRTAAPVPATLASASASASTSASTSTATTTPASAQPAPRGFSFVNETPASMVTLAESSPFSAPRRQRSGIEHVMVGGLLTARRVDSGPRDLNVAGPSHYRSHGRSTDDAESEDDS